MKYSRIYGAMCAMPWMLQPEKLEAFMEVLALRMEGGKLSPDEVAERTEHPRQNQAREMTLFAIDVEAAAPRGSASGQTPQNIAVIPVYGVIMHRPSMGVSSGGGFSIQDFREQFRAALANPSVAAIVLDVDSPGGSVDGVEEMATEIYQARSQKKIVAVADTLAASAAYYLGSAAEELAVTPSGEVGSIGVYMVHQDLTAAYEQNGVKNTLIKAGKFKAEGNPWMPLDEESIYSLQSQVDAHYDMFTKAVARNRGVGIDAVRNGFGQGRSVMAKEAVRLGMADKVATLDEVLKSLGAKGNSKSKKMSGEAEFPGAQAESDAAGSLDAALRQRELDI
jgi:signal peptide peptidase SppA